MCDQKETALPGWGRQMMEWMDLSLCHLLRQGLAGPLNSGPTCRLQGFRRRSGCVPAEPYLPRKHSQFARQASCGTTKYCVGAALFSF